jgi:methionine aminopeptidase
MNSVSPAITPAIKFVESGDSENVKLGVHVLGITITSSATTSIASHLHLSASTPSGRAAGSRALRAPTGAGTVYHNKRTWR